MRRSTRGAQRRRSEVARDSDGANEPFSDTDRSALRSPELPSLKAVFLSRFFFWGWIGPQGAASLLVNGAVPVTSSYSSIASNRASP